jgi:hypothetical protein
MAKGGDVVKTVQQLREWLANKPGGAVVEVLIEHGQCQYQFEANDFAFVQSKEAGGDRIVIMHEKWDGEK